MWVKISVYLVFICLIRGEINPGFKVHLTPKGLLLLEQFTKDSLKAYLDSTESKSVSGTSGSLEYRLSEIQVTNYDDSYQTIIEVVEGRGLMIHIRDLSFQIQSPYYVEYYFVWNNGHTTIDLHDVDFDIIIGAVENRGHLQPIIQGCDFSVAILTAEFRGGIINKVMNLFKSMISSKIKSTVESSICDIIEERMDEFLVPILANVALSTVLFDKYSLDYSLMQSPKFYTNYMESEHNGGIEAINRVTSRDGGVKYMRDKIQQQFPAPPFNYTIPVGIAFEQNKMINLYLTEWVLDSLFYYLSKYQVLNLAFTRESMPPNYKDILSTECDFLCIGTLYPNLAKLYPDSTLDVMMTIAESPRTSIGPDGINISTVLNFTGYIRKLNHSVQIDLNSTEVQLNDDDIDYVHDDIFYYETNNDDIDGDDDDDNNENKFQPLHPEISGGIPIFTGLADAVVKMDLHFVNSTIVANLGFDKFELDSFTSRVEGISVESFDFVMDTVVSEFIEPHFANLVKGGIHIPKTGPFKIVQGLIVPVPDLLVFSVDFLIV